MAFLVTCLIELNSNPAKCYTLVVLIPYRIDSMPLFRHTMFILVHAMQTHSLWFVSILILLPLFTSISHPMLNVSQPPIFFYLSLYVDLYDDWSCGL